MGEVIDARAKLVEKITEDWSIELRIGYRAAVLFRVENPELAEVLGKGVLNLAALMVTAFETAAIELRDEIEWVVLTDLAGMSAEDASELMNQRLAKGVSPITQRLAELSREVNQVDDDGRPDRQR